MAARNSSIAKLSIPSCPKVNYALSMEKPGTSLSSKAIAWAAIIPVPVSNPKNYVSKPSNLFGWRRCARSYRSFPIARVSNILIVVVEAIFLRRS
jgi:hypothetical protein